MRFIKINYHLNKNFFVEVNAYKKMVFKTLKTIKEKIKIKKITVIPYENKNSFGIFLEVKKDLKSGYFEIINYIQKELEEKSQLLINAKPIDIEIKFIKNEK